MRHSLLNQFNNAWKILEQAIEVVPDEEFSKNINDWSYSYTIYHVIETAEFYTREKPGGMGFGNRIGIDWNNDSSELIIEKKLKITKSLLLEYLNEVKENFTDKVDSQNDDEILAKDDFGEWFPSIYEKYIYLLRHNMFHIGELSHSLREVEDIKISWR